MNTMSLVQSKWLRHGNFAWDPLRLYFDECQKNEIHLLYLSRLHDMTSIERYVGLSTISFIRDVAYA